MGQKTSFFTIDRKLLEDALWLSEPFTKGQAWLDLIGRASYKDGEKAKRGEIITSERELADRWKWTRKKVRCFLRSLESAGMIKKTAQGPSEGPSEGPRQGTSIMLENYAFYQGQGPREGPREGPSEGPKNDISSYSNKTNKTNINNISIMPDGIREELAELWGGEKAEALLEEVRTYYQEHPEKDFPGWKEAALQFHANQQRWQGSRRQRDPMSRAIAAFIGGEAQ